MKTNEINLKSPDGLSIQGALTEDGSIRKIEFYLDPQNPIYDFILSNEPSSCPVKQSGEMVLVDTAGNRWFAGDVVDFTLMGRTF